jgi:hypothetical protein
VFENRVLRRIFGPKRNEVTVEWRNLQNRELHNLYSSPLERPRHRWEDGIKMDLRETGWWGVEWIQLAQDRDRWRAVVNAVMNLRVLEPRS